MDTFLKKRVIFEVNEDRCVPKTGFSTGIIIFNKKKGEVKDELKAKRSRELRSRERCDLMETQQGICNGDGFQILFDHELFSK